MPAKPFPPCTARELLLKSVTLPRTALQFEIRWSTGLSLAKKAFLRGLVLFPRPTALPDAKFPAMS